MRSTTATRSSRATTTCSASTSDTVAENRAVENLETEIISDSRIGGISAIFTIDNTFRGLASFLISGQRSQFAAFNLQNLLRGRNMAVLGGQFSVFSTHALREVMAQNHQSTPWVKDSEVEDSLLSLQIKSAGYRTKISPIARADVGGMTTLASLDAQQVKWTYGAIELMWPGQRGDTKGQPLHPNLRIRWFENFGMLTNLFVRIAFVLLLAGSLSLNAFVFSPVWLIPIGMAVRSESPERLRTVHIGRDRCWGGRSAGHTGGGVTSDVSRYPTPRTVSMNRGCAGLSPILRRRLVMCVSTARLSASPTK